MIRVLPGEHPGEYSSVSRLMGSLEDVGILRGVLGMLRAFWLPPRTCRLRGRDEDAALILRVRVESPETTLLYMNLLARLEADTGRGAAKPVSG